MNKQNLSQYLPADSELGYGNFRVCRTKTINILLVGRTKTGKTTIIETLLEPQMAIIGSGFSDTIDPFCNSLILNNKLNNESYYLNIIDTPGLTEMQDTEKNRSDEELLKLASKCVENNITSLNVVCFVSKANETHSMDMKIFQKVKDFLGDGYSDISMMVLTHCDEFDDEDLSEFENKISNHSSSKPCFDYCKLGIVRYGAVDFKNLKSFKESSRSTVVGDKLERIEQMRNTFLNKIVSCAEKGLKVSDIKGYSCSIQ